MQRNEFRQSAQLGQLGNSMERLHECQPEHSIFLQAIISLDVETNNNK